MLEDKDNKIAVRMAGINDIVAVITVIEKNILRVITPTMFIRHIDYLKSSQAELEKISNSKVKKESYY